MRDSEINDTSKRVQFWLQTLQKNRSLRMCKDIKECRRWFIHNMKGMDEGITPLDEQCFTHAVEVLPTIYECDIILY